jgi:phospho-N-acetylmuramoyl-pentapeptide-transferase
MLYEFLYAHWPQVRHITIRTAMAVITAFLIAVLIGPWVIRLLRRWKIREKAEKKDSAELARRHSDKSLTPTMGGLFIMVAVVAASALWTRFDTPFAVCVLAVTIGLTLLGFLDDFIKLTVPGRKGVSIAFKFTMQMVVGLSAGLYIASVAREFGPGTQGWAVDGVYVPILKTMIPLGALYPAFIALVIVGSSNAVNLTDGLDGLAAGLSAIAAGTFGVFAYVIGRSDASQYLGLFYLPGVGELSVFCVALTGAALGFLWFNSHPAEVFMGDTGSLALGGAIGAVAMLMKSELLLVVVGGVFVVEALSVIAQVGFFKYTARRYGVGRRVLLMAPLHHHFEKAGWAESKIIIRFWILGVLCALIAFSTLKIR